MKLNRFLIIGMMLLTILVMSGCANSGEQTIKLQPPVMMGTIITDSIWTYQYQNQTLSNSGVWYHIPESDAANLLLFIDQVERLLHNRLEIINLQSIKDKAITKIKKYH